MHDWVVIDAHHDADGGKPQDAAATVLAGIGEDGGLTRLGYAGRGYLLSVGLTRGEHGLIEVVQADLRDAADDAVHEHIAIKLLTPVQSLSRMEPWGRIRVRRGLNELLARAAASAGSAVS